MVEKRGVFRPQQCTQGHSAQLYTYSLAHNTTSLPDINTHVRPCTNANASEAVVPPAYPDAPHIESPICVHPRTSTAAPNSPLAPTI